MKNNKQTWIIGAIAVMLLPLLLQSFGNAWVRIADVALLYVLLALGLYTAAFIAEVVRAGVLSVPRSLLEAAETLGASPAQVRWKVLMPQALRAIRPPLTNQLLNLVKNSPLAVAVGYPDLVSVGNTALNQTGRVFECITLMLCIYLLLSWTVALAMHWVDRRTGAGGTA